MQIASLHGVYTSACDYNQAHLKLQNDKWKVINTMEYGRLWMAMYIDDDVEEDQRN